MKDEYANHATEKTAAANLSKGQVRRRADNAGLYRWLSDADCPELVAQSSAPAGQGGDHDGGFQIAGCDDSKESRRDEGKARMKIYVASSWRNEAQPGIVQALREEGHEVYDFRNPFHGNKGFHWSEIDPDWQSWSPEKYRENLKHPIAVEGFNVDFEAMKWCEGMLLVMPCGRSAHLELGWAIGAGKKTGILICDGEPELMYSLSDAILTSLQESIEHFDELNK